MELTARRAERSADERCPYCHDALAAPALKASEDLVACPGCATSHHRSCVEELGRCTIRGCERPLVLAPEVDAVTGRVRRAPITEEIRRRLRDRARRFVADHATAPRPWAPVFETPAATPEPALDGQAPDGARVQRFLATSASPAPPATFAGRLAAALEGAGGLPPRDRAERHRRVAELLRTPEAANEQGADEAAGLALEHERRAEELEALLATVYRPALQPPPSPNDPWSGQDVMVLVLLLLAALTALLMLGRLLG